MDFYGTLGRACAHEDTLYALLQAGMTGLRLNLSHMSLLEFAPLLEGPLRAAARRAGVQPKLVLDLRGPELRVGALPSPVLLTEGERVALGGDGIPVPDAVVAQARPGDEISLDDSALLLEVTACRPGLLDCRVVRGGLLHSKKSLAILGRELDTPTLTPEDLEDLSLAVKYGATHVLQPFVRGKEDLLKLRAAMSQRGFDGSVMAKIENRRGVERLDEIMDNADELCIARGDLGNSMPLWQLPAVQKELARRCRAAGKPFCLVTQLLWSMESRPVPTRAEVCDIYNGVLDGAGSLMLTGETAAGKYPVEAMDYLVKTAQTALIP